jgi:hypothetical protein
MAFIVGRMEARRDADVPPTDSGKVWLKRDFAKELSS